MFVSYGRLLHSGEQIFPGNEIPGIDFPGNEVQLPSLVHLKIEEGDQKSSKNFFFMGLRVKLSDSRHIERKPILKCDIIPVPVHFGV